MTTHVTETAAAPSELAVKHFQDMLAFETDCWDVHESLKSTNPDFILVDASRGASSGIVDALVALGVLKLEKPKQPLGVLADLVLQTHGGADAKMGGWRVGPYGAGHKCYR